MTTTSYRLPREVVPQSYDIVLDATPKQKSFSGAVTVTMRAERPVTSIELHALDLKVGKATVVAGKKRFAPKVVRHADRETVELQTKEAMPKGKLVVTLEFTGKLNPSMHGLYLAKDGPDRAIVSQCEATDARRIFPCCDEPDLKAILKWTVRTDPGLEVVTNGVPVARKKKGKQVVHTFKPTRIIPTYLAAVTIGTLEATKPVRIVGAPCRILAGPGKLSQTDFAIDVTRRVLPWFEDYFGQKYNYQKLDQVAVPGFDAGAMENVGAIFYRQNLLLMKPGATSWHAQKRIAEVIAHEIAHQWFGNLVTMKWWDDLWLNEAFATWIAYKSVDLWKPDWRMWDEYLESKESALEADALVSTHPVYSEVKSPAEATELFDVITYEKGCAVLRMCESYLGDGAFRDGIRRYQAAFKNANAAGRDLWQKLEEASGEPVGSLMQSWVTQPGFPLLDVRAKESGGTTVLEIEQRRFFANPKELEKPAAQTWSVPMLIRYEAGGTQVVQRALISERRATVTLPKAARWFYPNDGAAGFFRVRLDDASLSRLVENGIRDLPPAARMSLLDDQWALVRAGLSDVSRFLDVLVAYRDERDYLVVRSMAGRVGWIDQRLVLAKDRAAWQELVCWLFGPQLAEVGWDAISGEPQAQAVRRASVIGVLGDAGREQEVLAEAARRVGREMQDPSSVEPNLAGVLAMLSALQGDSARLDAYVKAFKKRKQERAAPELVSRYMSALGYFESPEVSRRVIDMCLDDTVPQEQLRTVLTPMISRAATQRAAWESLKQHWAELSPRVGLMGISRLVETTGALPVDLRDDVAAFFEKHPVEEAKRAVAKALEALALRKDFLQREQPRLSGWLERRQKRDAVAAR